MVFRLNECCWFKVCSINTIFRISSYVIQYNPNSWCYGDHRRIKRKSRMYFQHEIHVFSNCSHKSSSFKASLKLKLKIIKSYSENVQTKESSSHCISQLVRAATRRSRATGFSQPAFAKSNNLMLILFKLF